LLLLLLRRFRKQLLQQLQHQSHHLPQRLTLSTPVSLLLLLLLLLAASCTDTPRELRALLANYPCQVSRLGHQLQPVCTAQLQCCIGHRQQHNRQLRHMSSSKLSRLQPS
jgi:hypothetical protein